MADELMNDKPFFARFLEIQQPEQVKTAVKAGKGGKQTLKYPSDDADGGGGGGGL